MQLFQWAEDACMHSAMRVSAAGEGFGRGGGGEGLASAPLREAQDVAPQTRSDGRIGIP